MNYRVLMVLINTICLLFAAAIPVVDIGLVMPFSFCPRGLCLPIQDNKVMSSFLGWSTQSNAQLSVVAPTLGRINEPILPPRGGWTPMGV